MSADIQRGRTDEKFTIVLGEIRDTSGPARAVAPRRAVLAHGGPLVGTLRSACIPSRHRTSLPAQIRRPIAGSAVVTTSVEAASSVHVRTSPTRRAVNVDPARGAGAPRGRHSRDHLVAERRASRRGQLEHSRADRRAQTQIVGTQKHEAESGPAAARADVSTQRVSSPMLPPARRVDASPRRRDASPADARSAPFGRASRGQHRRVARVAAASASQDLRSDPTRRSRRAQLRRVNNASSRSEVCSRLRSRRTRSAAAADIR